MSNTKKREYMPPQVETLDTRIERGFAGSFKSEEQIEGYGETSQSNLETRFS